MTKPDQNDESAPKPGSRLGRALSGVPKTSVFIPAAVDEAVLAKARPRLARIRIQRLHQRQTQWLALAACLVVGAMLAQSVLKTILNRGATKHFAREDLNHDRRVDILDAFQLARELRDGTARTSDDFNGDGKVDAADVDLLARRAVSLEKGGHS